MKLKSNYLPILFCILCLVGACQASRTATAIATETPTISVSPTAAPSPTLEPTPEPTATPLPPKLADYPVDAEKLMQLPQNLKELEENRTAYQAAPDPLTTSVEFFEEWLEKQLIPAIPPLETAHIQAQYLANNEAAVSLVANNHRRRPLQSSPLFFYFEHDGVLFPSFYFQADFDAVFKLDPLTVILFPANSEEAEETLKKLADPKLNFDFLSLAKIPDAAYPQAVNQLIELGFKPSVAENPGYLMGFGSLYFALLP